MTLTIRNLLIRCAVPLAALAVAAAGPSVPAQTRKQPKKPAAKEALTPQDEQFLQMLVTKHIVDPKGLVRVEVPYLYRTVWGRSVMGKRGGWLVARGSSSRVYFIDTEYVTVADPSKLERIAYVAECRRRYRSPAKKGSDFGEELSKKLARYRLGAIEVPDLAHAAWLLRLGEKELAYQALKQARLRADVEPGEQGNRKLLRQMREVLAWQAFNGLVNAFIVRADGEALRHGERLLYFYDDLLEPYPQARRIVADINRRRERSSKQPRGLKAPPKEFAKWDTKAKIAFLIDRLDECDARQVAQPGGVDVVADWRVRELIRLGESAVPPLIDVLEKDRRLTRMVHFWRDFSRHRSILETREAALIALMNILGRPFFSPASTGDDFSSRSEEEKRAVVAKVKEYWQKYGSLPPAKRLMRILTDPKASPEDKRLAAIRLSQRKPQPVFSTMAFAYFTEDRSDLLPSLREEALKFQKPTAAEAILAALDAELQQAAKNEQLFPASLRGIEDSYLAALAELGDKRILPRITARAMKAKSVGSRLSYCLLAHYLGENRLLVHFAEDLASGKITPAELKKGGSQPAEELERIVFGLVKLNLPVAQNALVRLADPKHPCYATIRDAMLSDPFPTVTEMTFYTHPFCFKILRRELDNRTKTGVIFRVRGDSLEYRTVEGGGQMTLPKILEDPKSRLADGVERYCDRAAQRISMLVCGVPEYHALLRDAEARRQQIAAFLDRFSGSLMMAEPKVFERLISPSDFGSLLYRPKFAPLGRPATAADVAAGRAVFHLQGKGQVVEMSLPALARLKTQDGKPGEAVLIVQAERAPDGTIHYGILGRRFLQEMPADRVTQIEPLSR